jgi:hypothetical protein
LGFAGWDSARSHPALLFVDGRSREGVKVMSGWGASKGGRLSFQLVSFDPINFSSIRNGERLESTMSSTCR